MIKLNGVEIKLDKYPDGTFLFKDIPPIGGWCRDNIEWFFESMEEWLIHVIFLRITSDTPLDMVTQQGTFHRWLSSQRVK